MHRLIGPVLQQTGSTDPQYMQTYFHDPDFQASHRATRGPPNSPVSNDAALWEHIFRELHRILTEECTNTYLQSFISVNNFITERRLNPEELSIQMHATDKPPTGHHIGRYHLPNVLEIALLKDINPPTDLHRSIKCKVRGVEQEGHNDTLTKICDYH